MSMTMGTIHAMQTMNAQNKGSVVNRSKCAVEHFKNDVVTSAQGALITGATLGALHLGSRTNKIFTPAAVLKTSIGGQIGSKLMSMTGKITSGIAKVFSKIKLTSIGNALNKLGTKLSTNASVHGKAAFVALTLGAAAIGIAKIIDKHAYKSGQIDQKYEDLAKIEKMADVTLV